MTDKINGISSKIENIAAQHFVKRSVEIPEEVEAEFVEMNEKMSDRSQKTMNEEGLNEFGVEEQPKQDQSKQSANHWIVEFNESSDKIPTLKDEVVTFALIDKLKLYDESLRMSEEGGYKFYLDKIDDEGKVIDHVRFDVGDGLDVNQVIYERLEQEVAIYDKLNYTPKQPQQVISLMQALPVELRGDITTVENVLSSYAIRFNDGHFQLIDGDEVVVSEAHPQRFLVNALESERLLREEQSVDSYVHYDFSAVTDAFGINQKETRDTFDTIEQTLSEKVTTAIPTESYQMNKQRLLNQVFPLDQVERIQEMMVALRELPLNDDNKWYTLQRALSGVDLEAVTVKELLEDSVLHLSDEKWKDLLGYVPTQETLTDNQLMLIDINSVPDVEVLALTSNPETFVDELATLDVFTNQSAAIGDFEQEDMINRTFDFSGVTPTFGLEAQATRDAFERAMLGESLTKDQEKLLHSLNYAIVDHAHTEIADNLLHIEEKIPDIQSEDIEKNSYSQPLESIKVPLERSLKADKEALTPLYPIATDAIPIIEKQTPKEALQMQQMISEVTQSWFDPEKLKPENIHQYALEVIKEFANSPESMERFFNHLASQPDLSPQNAALIEKQWKGAQMVKTFKDWQADSEKFEVEDVIVSTRTFTNRQTGESRTVLLDSLSVKAGEKARITLYEPVTRTMFAVTDKQGKEVKDEQGRTIYKPLAKATLAEKEKIQAGDVPTVEVQVRNSKTREPLYRTFKAFEVSQTNLKEASYEKIDKQLTVDGQEQKLYQALETFAREAKIHVEKTNDSLLLNDNQSVHFDKSKQTIYVKDSQEPKEEFLSLTEGLARAASQIGKQSRSDTQIALETDFTEQIIKRSLGVETKVPERLSQEIQSLNTQELSQSLRRVHNASKKIIYRLKQVMNQENTTTKSLSQPINQPLKTTMQPLFGGTGGRSI